jgi:hypothetical protein
MPKTCKIDQMGLSETVQRLMAEGVTTRADMTERLRSEHGADVSEATVGRYMARVRRAAEGEAFAYIQDHVNRTVPDDMEALEEMERTALDWSREAGASQSERAALAAERIAGEIEEWRDRLLSFAEKDQQQFVRWVIKRCTSYLAEDDRRQEQRLSAMRMVHKIIETKLSKAGLLDDEQKGRIIFLQRAAAGEEDLQRGSGSDSGAGAKLRLVKDGAEND